MSSHDSSLPNAQPFSAPPAGATAPAPRPAVPPALPPNERPGTVSVMCPAAFTDSSTKGLSPDKRLFARVTYRPR